MFRFWILLLPFIILLSACEDVEPEEASKVFITFYPPANAFDLDCEDNTDSEICTFNRAVIFDGSNSLTVKLKNRKDGILATDGEGEFLKITGTYFLSFYNSTQVDIYQGEILLYSYPLFNYDNDKHLCMPIIPMDTWMKVSQLTTSHPENDEQALNYIEECRKLNLDFEVPFPEVENKN